MSIHTKTKRASREFCDRRRAEDLSICLKHNQTDLLQSHSAENGPTGFCLLYLFSDPLLEEGFFFL